MTKSKLTSIVLGTLALRNDNVMCRILLFIFLATATYAEAPKKKNTADKVPENKLSSYNKELTEKLKQQQLSESDFSSTSPDAQVTKRLQGLLQSQPQLSFDSSVLISSSAMTHYLKNRALKQSSFNDQSFYTALLHSFLVEKNYQTIESSLHRTSWLAGNKEESLNKYIKHLSTLSHLELSSFWGARINYTLSLLLEAKGDHSQSLSTIQKALQYKNVELRELIRRQLLICASRTNQFEVYGNYISSVKNSRGDKYQKFEELNDALSVQLLIGHDSPESIKELGQLQPNYEDRLTQIKILSGLHDAAYQDSKNKNDRKLIPFLLKRKSYELAAKSIQSEPDPFQKTLLQLEFQQARDGAIDPKLILKSSQLAQTSEQKSQLFQWQIGHHLFTENLWTDLQDLALKGKSTEERFRAFFVSSKQLHAARLFAMLPKNISRHKLFDILTLMTLTSSESSFLAYTDLLQREFKFTPAELSLVVTECTSLALQKSMPNAALAILSLIDEKNHNIQQVLISSIALIQKSDFMGAAHNGLIRQNLRVPALMEMATFSLKKSNKLDKAKKSSKISYSYYTSIKSLLTITSYFEQNHLPEISQSIYEQINSRPLSFDKNLLALLQAASNNYLSQENYKAWMKISGLYLGYALLHPDKIYSPAESIRLRSDILRHRLLHAIHDKNQQLAKETTSKWVNEFPGDIEPVIILHQFCANDKEYRTTFQKAFHTQWDTLTEHVTKHPDAVSQLNMLAWMAATCHIELKQALLYARHAYKLQPQAAYLDTLAQCLYASGKTEQATKFLKQCIAQDPSNFYYSNKLALWQADSSGKQ